MKQELATALELEGEKNVSCIPLNIVMEAICTLPTSSHLKIMFWMAAETGCRLKALDNMRRERLIGNMLYWNDGKGKGHERRKELSQALLSELVRYRKDNKVYDSRLFGISAESFRRSFNGEGRALLGGDWQVKVIRPRDTLQVGYKYQLKGLRKNFATKKFRDYWEEFSDAGVALQFTARDMRHKAVDITAYHYIKEINQLGSEEPSGQTTLLAYTGGDDHERS